MLQIELRLRIRKFSVKGLNSQGPRHHPNWLRCTPWQMYPFQDFGRGAKNQWKKGREVQFLIFKSRNNLFKPFLFSLKVERSLSIPKNTQEFKEIVLNKIVPESLVKPCVVRCKVCSSLIYCKAFITHIFTYVGLIFYSRLKILKSL